jgi:hypothetical protein
MCGTPEPHRTAPTSMTEYFLLKLIRKISCAIVVGENPIITGVIGFKKEKKRKENVRLANFLCVLKRTFRVAF